LRPGDVADLVLFDLVGEPPELIVRATLSAGEVVFGKAA